ncbi:MAG: hypothetical protein ACJAYU_000032 [Bradymonadia bacterium]|jgi:hypothetical protein
MTDDSASKARSAHSALAQSQRRRLPVARDTTQELRSTLPSARVREFVRFTEGKLAEDLA